MPQFGVTTSLVDMCDVEQVRAALRPETRMLWIETPSNPLLRITDIRAVVAAGPRARTDHRGRQHLPQPLLPAARSILGVDVVVHSTTKYLNGHSDVVGGAVITGRDDLAERLALIVYGVGLGCSPFDAWLVLRGVKTLAPRMEAHQRGAQAVAAFLQQHPAVRHVYYPGLPRHPGHELALSQQSGFGGHAELRAGHGRAGPGRLPHPAPFFAWPAPWVGWSLSWRSLDGPATPTCPSRPSARRASRRGPSGSPWGSSTRTTCWRTWTRRFARSDDYRGTLAFWARPPGVAADGTAPVPCSYAPNGAGLAGRADGHNLTGQEAADGFRKERLVEVVMDETTILGDRTNGSATFIERLAEKIGLQGRASLVFGEPITQEVTVVPVSKARWGFGGGAGTGSGKEGEGEGSGGGGGLMVTPVGYIELAGAEAEAAAPKADPAAGAAPAKPKRARAAKKED